MVRIDGPLGHHLAAIVRLDQVVEHRPVDELAIGIEPLQMATAVALADDRFGRPRRWIEAENGDSYENETFHGWTPLSWGGALDRRAVGRSLWGRRAAAKLSVAARDRPVHSPEPVFRCVAVGGTLRPANAPPAPRRIRRCTSAGLKPRAVVWQDARVGVPQELCVSGSDRTTGRRRAPRSVSRSVLRSMSRSVLRSVLRSVVAEIRTGRE